jgi:hypothetical protein
LTGGSLYKYYAPIETFDQLGHEPSSMNSQPINDRRAEIERCAIDSDNRANESHGATEDTLATMTYGTLPTQPQVGLNQDSAAVEISLERTTSTVVDST